MANTKLCVIFMHSDYSFVVYSFIGFSYLLITGKAQNGSSRQGEVLSEWKIHTMTSIRLCSGHFNYPLDVAFATGGLLNSTAVICGGEDDDLMVTDKCYSYVFKTKHSRGWKNLVNMSEPRSFSSSIVIDDMIWITGGYNKNHDTLTSTEQIFLNKTHQAGPDLQGPRESHCMASYENKIFIIGGSKTHLNAGTSLNQVQMYNGNGLFKMPVNVSSMNYRRKNHACTIFQSQIHGGRYVLLVAGGDQEEKASKTAEILDFLDGIRTKWKLGNL